MLPKSTQLAATTYMEHFTALLAERLLEDKQFANKADPEMIKLWQWHAIEELEHKAVAYDVYELAGNSQAERAVAAAAVIAALVPAAVASWAWLVAKEGKATDIKDVRKGISLLLGKRGFVTRILPKMPLFNRKGYHPPAVARPGACVNCTLCEMLCPEFAIFSHAAPDPPVRGCA